MDQAKQDYDYGDAGFDSFMDRSIDTQLGPPATNLDSQTYQGQELNYDQAPTTGALGSAFQSGNIRIDGVGGSISVLNDSGNEVVRLDETGMMITDNGTPRARLGFKDENFAIKVSQKGKDVTSAGDQDLVLSSDFNTYKIVDSGTVSLTSTGAPTGAAPVTYIYAHNLGYNPGIIAYVDDGTYRLPLPYININALTAAIRSRISAQIEKNVVTFVLDDFVGSVFTVNIKFYLLRETAS